MQKKILKQKKSVEKNKAICYHNGMIRDLWGKIKELYSIPKGYREISADNNVMHMHQLMFCVMMLGIYWLCCDLLFSRENARFSFLISYDITMIVISFVPFVVSFFIIKSKITSITVKLVFIYVASFGFFITLLWRLAVMNDITDVGFIITSIIYLLTYCMSIVLLFDVSPIVYVVSIVTCAAIMTVNLGHFIFKVDIFNIYLFCIALLIVSMYKRRASITSMRQKMLVEDMNNQLELQAQQLQLQQIELNEANEELLTQQETLIQHKANLENEVLAQTKELRERNQKIINLQNHTIIALSTLVENRDADTGNHVRRTAEYVKLLTQQAYQSGLFPELNENSAELFAKAAPMHDIGKIVISDAILKKPDRLTPEEFEQIKKHTIEGGRIVKEILGVGEDEDYIRVATDIATCHHEKYNGTGYPYGKKGEEIPLCARIMAVADVFDALVSQRCYKEPMNTNSAFEIIKKEAGVHFDPIIADIFLQNQYNIINIMHMFNDN